MKKTLIGLFASVALVLSTGALGSSAVAAPYPSTVKTTSTITRTSSVTEGKNFTVAVRVRAGNATINSGVVTVIFGSKKVSKPVRNGFAYLRVRAPQVNKTKLRTIKAHYKRAAGSVYKSSSTSKKLLVKNK